MYQHTTAEKKSTYKQILQGKGNIREITTFKSMNWS